MALDLNRRAQDSPLNRHPRVRSLAGLDFQVNQQENRYQMSQLKLFSGSLQRELTEFQHHLKRLQND
jgi:hypothetical protein